MDTLTGIAMNMGSSGVMELNGLLAIPEPATILVLALGVVIIRRKHG